jgi:hypothetical protein
MHYLSTDSLCMTMILQIQKRGMRESNVGSSFKLYHWVFY